MMKNTGAEVFVLIVPDGKDPDEFIQKHGKADFEELLKNVTPVVDYQFQYKLNHTDYSTLQGKLQVLREMLPFCAEIKDSLIQKEYLKKFSAVLLLDEDLVLEEWRKFSLHLPHNKINNQKKLLPTENSLIRRAGETIIKTLWNEPDFLDLVNSSISTQNFTGVHSEIINYIKKCYGEDRMPDASTEVSELSEKANLEILRILANDELPENQMTGFQDSISVMKRLELEKRYRQISKEAKEFEKAGDIKSANEKFQALINLQKEMLEL